VTRLSVADTTTDDANVTYACRLTSAAGQAESSARFVIQRNHFLSQLYVCIFCTNRLEILCLVLYILYTDVVKSVIS